MAISNYFYNRLIKKYVSLFGGIFNKISISRYDNSETMVQRMPVPIMFSPWQKFLNKIKQDPTLTNKTSAILPMMTFELINIAYDPNRKIHTQNRIETFVNGAETYAYSPVPYIMHFNLNIWTANMEDGTQIVEQIFPFFQPDYTPSVFLINNFESIDIPIVLESVTQDDVYEGDYNSRRVVRWTLTFSMLVYFFGPTKQAKRIKFVDIETRANMNPDTDYDIRVTSQPGLTANGEPTSDITETIPYQDINIDDDWGVITQIFDNT